MTQRTMDELVAAYVKLRDRKKEMENRLKKDLEPIVEAMAKLEAHFLLHMQSNGVTSFATVNGTAYQSRQPSVSVADWEVFFKWAMASDQLGMLVRGANKAAVAAYAEETETVPPGLNFSQALTVNVRRS